MAHMVMLADLEDLEYLEDLEEIITPSLHSALLTQLSGLHSRLAWERLSPTGAGGTADHNKLPLASLLSSPHYKTEDWPATSQPRVWTLLCSNNGKQITEHCNQYANYPQFPQSTQ